MGNPGRQTEAEARVVEWLKLNFLPFEAELRLMLRRVCRDVAEVDDVIQETCYRVLSMKSTDHVIGARAFLVQTARNILTDRLRREAIVSIEVMANMEDLQISDTGASPERVVMARAELNWVLAMISRLPERCKKVFQARRLHGLSQQETAEALGINVGLVEYEMVRALDLISQRIGRTGVGSDIAMRKTRKNLREASQDDAEH